MLLVILSFFPSQMLAMTCFFFNYSIFGGHSFKNMVLSNHEILSVIFKIEIIRLKNATVPYINADYFYFRWLLL